MKANVIFTVIFGLVASNALVAATPANNSQNPGSWQLVNRSEATDKPKYNDSAAHPVEYNQGQVSSSDSYNYNSGTTSTSSKSNFQNSSTTTVSDKDLKTQIQSQLSQDPAASNVKASVSNSKVTLEGTVASQSDSKRIETAVKRISGVSSVFNKITVQAAR